MKSTLAQLGVIAIAGALIVAGCMPGDNSPQKLTQEQMIAEGEYLVVLGGCNDCHTPKKMTEMGPAPDPSLLLSGHRAGAPIPEYPAEMIGKGEWMAMTDMDMTTWAGPWGISFAANLTPDNVTGCGGWTEEMFVSAMRNGKHLGAGRPILPPMPWQAIGQCTDEELKAILAYLKSIKPIANRVPDPVPPPGAPGSEVGSAQ